MTKQEDASRSSVLIGAGVLFAIAVALLVYVLSTATGSDQLTVDVAPGTAERLADGEVVELLPRTLEVSVGDSLEVRNRDDVVHEVGPYTVAPGQTLRQTFTSPGTIEGLCTLHDSGAITIVVR